MFNVDSETKINQHKSGRLIGIYLTFPDLLDEPKDLERFLCLGGHTKGNKTRVGGFSEQ